MNQEQLVQFAGKLEDLYAEAGIQPRLRFGLTVNNKNKSSFDLLSFKARLHIQFPESGRAVPSGLGPYVGEVERETYSTSVNPGDNNNVQLYFPMPFSVLSELEGARTDKDVIVEITATYAALERSSEGGNRVLTGDLIDPRGGSNAFLFIHVAKSRWDELLNALGYSEELRGSKQSLIEAVRSAQRAKAEAEEAAKAAKGASAVVAVTTLSQAYSDEAATLRKTSHRWLAAGVVVAAFTIVLMGFYVFESFKQPEFTASQTIIRVAVLGVLFGGFGLCIRSYNAYQHLELLNRHRVNIGKTFEQFKSAQPSDKAKDVLAALTAEQMIDFGRGNFPGKEAESQLPLVSELVKALIDRPKT